MINSKRTLNQQWNLILVMTENGNALSNGYGYKKDPENPKHWIVDEEAAVVVKQIFAWCMFASRWSN